MVYRSDKKQITKRTQSKVLALIIAAAVMISTLPFSTLDASAATKKPAKPSVSCIVKEKTISMKWPAAKYAYKYQIQKRSDSKGWHYLKKVSATSKNKKKYSVPKMYKVVKSGKYYKVYEYCYSYSTLKTTTARIYTYKATFYSKGYCFRIRSKAKTGSAVSAWAYVYPVTEAKPNDEEDTTITDPGENPDVPETGEIDEETLAEYRQKLEEAEKAVKVCEEALEKAKRDQTGASVAVDNAEGDLKQAKSDLEKASETLAAVDKIIEKQSGKVSDIQASLAQIDKSSDSYKTIKNDVEKAELKLSLAMKEMEEAEEKAADVAATLNKITLSYDDISSKKKTLDSLAEAESTAKEVLDAANQTLAEKESACDEAKESADKASEDVTDAENKLKQAEKNLQTATTEADAANSRYEAELESPELEEFENRKKEADEALEEAKSEYDNAGKTFLESRLTYGADGNKRTFESMYNDTLNSHRVELYGTLSTDAKRKKFDTFLVSFLKTQNLIKAANFIKEGNGYRNQEGVSTLNLTCDLMLFSALSNAVNVNDKTRHILGPGYYEVLNCIADVSIGENLAWTAASSPYNGWYHQEKIFKERYENGDESYLTKFGHYSTLIDDRWVLTGFSTDGGNSEQFFSKSVYRTNKPVDLGTEMTPDQFISELSAYADEKKSAYDDAKAASDALGTEPESLTNARNEKEEKDKAKANAEEAVEKANKALETATNTYAEAEKALSDAKAEYDGYRAGEWQKASDAHETAVRNLADFDEKNPGVSESYVETGKSYDNAVKAKEEADEELEIAEEAKELAEEKYQQANSILESREQKIADTEKELEKEQNRLKLQKNARPEYEEDVRTSTTDVSEKEEILLEKKRLLNLAEESVKKAQDELAEAEKVRQEAEDKLASLGK